MTTWVSAFAFFVLLAGLWTWTAYRRRNAHVKKRAR